MTQFIRGDSCGFVGDISFELSMDVPFAGFVDAEEPEAQGCFGFDGEVVAGFEVALPPLAGDAFGAGGVGDAVVSSLEGEGDGAAVAAAAGMARVAA